MLAYRFISAPGGTHQERRAIAGTVAGLFDLPRKRPLAGFAKDFLILFKHGLFFRVASENGI